MRWLLVLVVLLWPRAASAEDFERRGLRRAGIALFTVGSSAWPSSLALLLSTEGRLGPEAAGMALSGHVMVAAGSIMWARGDVGRRTTPRDRTLMFTGLSLAGTGLALLPPSSALLAMSFDPDNDDERRDRLRLAALGSGIAAHLLIAVGIPIWAHGAASPDDVRVGAFPGGAMLSARF